MPDNMLAIGNAMPEFAALPSTDGKQYSSKDFDRSTILVIVFSCNHCPYVRAYEDRMIALQRDYSPRGVQLVAVNSNETANYPEDRFEEMVKRAKAKGFNFPYLRDENQSVADAFGATHTPQFFAFARSAGGMGWTLRYSGKMDDNWEHPTQVKENYLRNTLDALLAGSDVPTPETYSIGCTIKWR
jgi:peroxiredoxin